MCEGHQTKLYRNRQQISQQVQGKTMNATATQSVAAYRHPKLEHSKIPTVARMTPYILMLRSFTIKSTISINFHISNT